MFWFKKREGCRPKPYIRNIAGNFRNEGHIHVGDPETVVQVNRRLRVIEDKLNLLIDAQNRKNQAEDDGPNYDTDIQP